MKRIRLVSLVRPHEGDEAAAVLTLSAVRAERISERERFEFLRRRGRVLADEALRLAADELRQPKPADEEPEQVDPVRDALMLYPARYVVEECLHTVGGNGGELLTAPRWSVEERAEWVEEQRKATLDHLAEDILRDAGLIDETEEERGNG